MLSVDEVLKHYKMEVYSEFGDEKRCLCPFHNDHNPSFDINSEGMWICRSHCGGGNLIQFVMKKENVDYATAELLLNNNFSLIISDRGGKLQMMIDQMRKANEAYVEETLPRHFVDKFVMAVLDAVSRLPTTNQDVISDWVKVLIYVKADTESHTEKEYLNLHNEFLQDIESIRGQ